MTLPATTNGWKNTGTRRLAISDLIAIDHQAVIHLTGGQMVYRPKVELGENSCRHWVPFCGFCGE
jgi:hypothetical protein